MDFINVVSDVKYKHGVFNVSDLTFEVSSEIYNKSELENYEEGELWHIVEIPFILIQQDILESVVKMKQSIAIELNIDFPQIDFDIVENVGTKSIPKFQQLNVMDLGIRLFVDINHDIKHSILVSQT